MIKHIADISPNILSFYVEEEMDPEDVEWMMRLIETTYKRNNQKVHLFVEFGDFGTLTFKRTFKHWYLLNTHASSLINHVDKIVATSDSVLWRSRLLIEFNLLPSVSLRAYRKAKKHRGIQWLQESVREQQRLKSVGPKHLSQTVFSKSDGIFS